MNRLLILNTGGGIGGTEKMAGTLARQFQQSGLPVTHAAPHCAASPEVIAWYASQNMPVVFHEAVPTLATSRDRNFIQKLRQFVRQSDADVVNIHYGGNYISIKDIIAIRLSGRRRCVASVYHPSPWDHTNLDKKRSTQLGSRLLDTVVVASKAMHQVALQAGVPAKKLVRIPCAASPPTRLPTVSEARDRLGIPRDRFVVGFLGRLVPEKGADELIRAASLLSTVAESSQGTGTPPLHIVIGGDGPQRTTLIEQADKLLPTAPRVQVVGRIDDVNDFYAACDVFALPSHMEGFGLVYVEAAFHGVPSIGTDVGGVPDVIEDGKSGLLVPVASAERLADAIQKLYCNKALRQQLGEEARNRALHDFSAKVMTERYARIFSGGALV